MLTVHHLGISQSERIVWLCEELALPYELRRYKREANGLAPAAYKALHWSGTAPVITDDTLVLAESMAIVNYLVARYGNGRLTLSSNHPDFATYLYWFHYVNGTLVPSILATRSEGPIASIIGERLHRGLQALDAHLAKDQTWIAGDTFTTADIMMIYSLTTGRIFAPFDLSHYSAIKAYLHRISERPAYRRAREKSDPGMPLMLD